MDEEKHLKQMQKAYIDKTVREVLAVHPVTYDQLVIKAFKKLIPNSSPNAEDKQILKTEIFEMLVEGKIDINKGKISVEGRYRVNSVEEDYKLNNVDEVEGEKNINGSYKVLTVGSERYPFFWSSLELGKIITVELIAEPENKKDPHAVAVCINKKPYAYLPREEAPKYHPLVMQANKNGFIVVTSALVSTYPENPSVKLFELNITPSEILKKHLDKTTDNI